MRNLGFLLLFLGASAAYGDTLHCQSSPEVTGSNDAWSPFAQCQKGYIATGIAKLDLLGDHQTKGLHVNDQRCEDRGCRVWCVGSPCTMAARCCRVVAQPGGK